MVSVLSELFYSHGEVIIHIMAAFNFAVLIVMWFYHKKSDRVLHPSGNIKYGIQSSLQLTKGEVANLQKRRDGLLVIYSLYANITAIFPILGILGTVAALIMQANSENLTDNLMVALNTTLLGAVYAIFFKVCDSIVSAKVDAFVDDADYVMRKISISEGE